MAAIELDGIGLRYPGQQHHTLKNISLTLEDDGSTVIIGPSGCGKTSLLNIVAGFIQPTEGRLLREKQILTQPGADRVVVFQDDALMPWLDVADNVALGLKIRGRPAAERRMAALEALEKVGLAHAAEKQIWELSGGMRQRVGIARALAVHSAFLLLDEPFGALDAFTREQMQELVLHIWQHQQTALFLITHDIEEALLLASRLVLMAPHPGSIAEVIEPDFSSRWRQGASVRDIKSAKDFIELREYLFYKLMARTPANYEVSI